MPEREKLIEIKKTWFANKLLSAAQFAKNEYSCAFGYISLVNVNKGYCEIEYDKGATLRCIFTPMIDKLILVDQSINGYLIVDADWTQCSDVGITTSVYLSSDMNLKVKFLEGDIKAYLCNEFEKTLNQIDLEKVKNNDIKICE